MDDWSGKQKAAVNLFHGFLALAVGGYQAQIRVLVNALKFPIG
jgi:hypothetical protein